MNSISFTQTNKQTNKQTNSIWLRTLVKLVLFYIEIKRVTRDNQLGVLIRTENFLNIYLKHFYFKVHQARLVKLRFSRPFLALRPRGSQSGREKRRDESFRVRAKEPLGTDSHRTISKNSSGCRSLIGHEKRFVLLCPIGEQFLLSSFREFVHDGYCLATLARFVHQACACKGNFYFLLS